MSIKVDEKHPAERYARAVVAGEIIACKWVRLACERHLRDLREGDKRGLSLDRGAADRALKFFGFLCHSKGRWAGQPFELAPWQKFIVYSLFGWKKANGARRFREAHVEVARKNGKTTLWAGIGLYLLFGDGEPGAEVYCAATKKDQAKILFSEAEKMRAASPGLRKRIQSFRNNMNVPATGSKFEILASDAKKQDGLNISGAIVDEFHEHKTKELWDKIDTATGARFQPLLAKITTAGYDKISVCWEHHEYATRILEQVNHDDSVFVYIATLDEGDDWQDERNWIKANPNLGVSVTIEDLRARAKKPKQDLSALASFLRYRMDVWTSAVSYAVKMEDWRKCVGFSLAGKDERSLRTEVEKQLEGRECFIAVDLSETEDLTCSGKLFPPEEPKDPYIFLPDFWLPEDNLEKKIGEWRVPYDVWAREGFIRTTDGNVVDYDAVKAQVLQDADRYQVREICFDPWNGTQFANELQKAGVPVDKLVKFPQTFEMFAEATKQLLGELIPSRRIAHLGNPVLSWMASNLAVREHPSGAKRPAKDKSRAKIDGMVSLLMALARAIRRPGSGASVYETRGILTL